MNTPTPDTPFLRRHRPFLLGFGVWLVVAGITLLRTSPPDEIFFFNDWRSPAANAFFRFFSAFGGEEWGIVATFVALLFVRYRSALTVLPLGFSVAVVSAAAKDWFAHERPMAFLREAELWHLVKPVEGVVVHSGATSFPSGHTMTAFAMMGFLAFCLPRRHAALPLLLLAVAVLTGLARIYLVQHFLKDIYLGSLMGVGLAAFWWYGQRWWGRAPWLDRRLSLQSRRTLAFRVAMPPEAIFTHLADASQYPATHPLITNTIPLGGTRWRVREQVPLGPLPYRFGYTAHVNADTDAHTVCIRANVQQLTHIQMDFHLRPDGGGGTQVEEHIRVRSIMPVHGVLHGLFRKQHTAWFQNMEKAG